jgi:hypothetical protein
MVLMRKTLEKVEIPLTVVPTEFPTPVFTQYQEDSTLQAVC